MDPTICKGIQVKGIRYRRFIFYLTLLPPWRNLNVTLSGDFECEKPHETPLLEINRKDNKMETLRDDIMSIVEQTISKTTLDMVSHKKFLVFMYMENGTTIINIMGYKFKLQMKGK